LNKIISLLIAVVLYFSYQTTIFAQTESPEHLSLKSEAAVLLDTDTNAVLYAKNPNEKLYPASVTKIATAIYAIEKGNLNDMVTVSANAVRQDGTRVYLVEGEKMPLKQLIQGMLINSGNDAAVAIAEYLDGSVEQFAKNINEYLKTTIGVKNTHFTNPNGLFDKNHYTTAMDLALITNYAMKNPVFAEIFGTKRLNWVGKAWKTTLITHHAMLKGEYSYPGITGGKTGYVTQSKQTLATTANNGKLKLTAIVLKSNAQIDKYNDTALLFNFGFKEYQHSILAQKQIYKTNNKEYYPVADTLITEDVHGCIQKISQTGLLTIENQVGQVLQSVQLKLKEAKPKIIPKQKQAKAKEPESYNLNALSGFAVIAIGLILILGMRKFKKQNMPID